MASSGQSDVPSSSRPAVATSSGEDQPSSSTAATPVLISGNALPLSFILSFLNANFVKFASLDSDLRVTAVQLDLRVKSSTFASELEHDLCV